MHSKLLTCLALTFFACAAVATTSGSINAIDEVTDTVLELTAHDNPNRLSPPSTRHLLRRRLESFHKRQNIPVAPTSESLIGIGGRIYIANVTFGGQRLALVIDSGSSDTWAATSNFQCQDYNGNNVAQSQCAFGTPLYNRAASSTWKSINYAFSVDYQGGEYIDGDMGNETFGIGGISTGRATPYVNINQTIGTATSGYWTGDGISVGLMGLAYPALARGVNNRQLNYTSVMYTMFQNASIPPVFSLALNRPTTASLRAGGLLAIGGIPNVTNDGRWATTPITPIASGIYAYYAINIDGFDITAPTPTTTPAPATPTNSYAASKQNMIIDSGSSLMYLPDAIAQYIGTLFLPAARYDANYNTYLVPCTARAPKLGIKIGGQSYFLSDDDLMNRGPGAVGGTLAGARAGECVVAVQNAMGGTLVLGDAWLKNVVVVFDVANGTDYGPGGSDKLKNGGGSVRIVGRGTY